MTRHSASLLDRRRLLKLGGATLGAAALGRPSRVLAATPPHSFKHGAFEITVVSDGYLVLPTSILGVDAPKPELEALLEAAGEKPDQFQPATNITLIRTPSDLIMIDTGSGANFQPTAGRLVENLEAAGIDPGKITKVVFSHAHPDHAWGTLNAADAERFPNARYFVSEAEWNFWMDADLIKKTPEVIHPFVVGAQRNFGRIKDKVKTVKPGEDIVTGVRVLDAAGHTPGHIALEISGSDGLVVVGDVVPHTVISLAHPDWRFAFDMIHDVAVSTRRKLFDRAASGKTKLIGYHWPYPGAGYIERKDGAYRYVRA